MRLEAASPVLQACLERDWVRASEWVSVQGWGAQVAAPEADLGGEPGRAVAQARMKSMEFWAR